MNNESKRLYKSQVNRKLCGVCGGIGEYLNIDPTVIRLLWILFSFCVGCGLLAYIIAAIIMPE
ncbi:MAG: PspC domain-containing protein [Lachnospiraceae bacterium]|nr:PspC domain-containing protein [Lachnospiraceae bacterium]